MKIKSNSTNDPLPEYKQDFISFLIRTGVLKFGSFITKSGRKSPYFFNLGNCNDGPSVDQLAQFYASTIMNTLGHDFDNLFGPAYKGIPLTVSITMVISQRYGRHISFTYNRKEGKIHGEGGLLIGHCYRNQDTERVVIVDDVLTSGKSIRDSIALLNKVAPSLAIKAIVIAVDRQECSCKRDQSTLVELSDHYGIKTTAIVTLTEIIDFLSTYSIDGKWILNDEKIDNINRYRQRYGSTENVS